MAFYLMSQRSKKFTPEEPKIYENAIKPDTFVAFVDFVPGVLKPGMQKIGHKQATDFEYHSFSVIFGLANKWLSENHEWEAFSAETVTLLRKASSDKTYELKFNDTCDYDIQIQNNYQLKALRLWIKRKQKESNLDHKYQILKYMDFKPHVLETVDGKEKVEDLSVIVERVNDALKEGQINGKIISIDSVPCEANADWKIDPEISFNRISNKYVINLRVVYDESTDPDEEIGIEDFIPECISKPGLFTRPKYEPFSTVIRKAKLWVKENSPQRVLNAKSVTLRLTGETTNTSSMAYSVTGDFLKLYRLVYVVSKGDNEEKLPKYSDCETYLPLTKKETIGEINKRMQEDIQCAFREEKTENGFDQSRFLCCETVEVICKNSVENIREEVESSFMRTRLQITSGFLCYVFRVFYETNALTWNKFEAEEEPTEPTSGPLLELNTPDDLDKLCPCF